VNGAKVTEDRRLSSHQIKIICPAMLSSLRHQAVLLC